MAYKRDEYLSSDKQLLNAEVRKFARSSKAQMLDQIERMGLVGKGDLYFALKENVRYIDGVADRISYRMPRHGILREKGVGRGVGMKNGKRYGKTKTISPETALSRRQPKPWFSIVLDKSVPELANIVASINSNAVINLYGIPKKLDIK